MKNKAPALTCGLGEPWVGPHPLCGTVADELEAAFWRDVAAGIYDAKGYTPNERKAQQRRTTRPVRECR